MYLNSIQFALREGHLQGNCEWRLHPQLLRRKPKDVVVGEAIAQQGVMLKDPAQYAQDACSLRHV